MIPDSNILNNKRSLSSFSVQILSIFTFSRRKRASFSQNPIILGYEKSHFPAGAKGNYKYVGTPATDMLANREPVMLERCEPTVDARGIKP